MYVKPQTPEGRKKQKAAIAAYYAKKRKIAEQIERIQPSDGQN